MQLSLFSYKGIGLECITTNGPNCWKRKAKLTICNFVFQGKKEDPYATFLEFSFTRKRFKNSG